MSDDIDVQVIVPDDAKMAIELRVPESAYRFVLLERAFAANTEGTLGTYILLGPAPGENGAWTFYVGKVGTGTVAQRIASHLRDKSWWNRVLVILPGWNDTFTSASAGYLEGALYQHLSDFRFAVALNNNTPADDTPTDREKSRLRRSVLPNVTAILRLLGYDLTRGRAQVRAEIPDPVSAALTAEPDRLPARRENEPDHRTNLPTSRPSPGAPGLHVRRTHWGTISGMVARGYLHDGETLQGPGGTQAKVVSNGNLIVNGQSCSSPHRAWAVATNPPPGKTQNAWLWWRAARDGGTKTIHELRGTYEAAHPDDEGSF
ncbi:hypothetical protein [Isoptericola sp. NPDC056134]|uniref:hypothetical protein n=1 Tax=Isoptericola sp. NPDC056134 TaxID=3345723 RepID=UPI0035EF3978